MHRAASGTIWVVPIVAAAILQIGCQSHRERYSLPCHAARFAPSGDGTLVWFACQELPRRGETPTIFRPATIYALELSTGLSTELAQVPGLFEISAAPAGNQVTFFWPHDSGGREELVLYQGTRRIGALPVDREAVWSADAKHLLFISGSSTFQGDAGDILAILDLKNFSISKQVLLEPTEGIYVHPRTGHILEGSSETIDYDAKLHNPRRIAEFPPGDVSATGSYIATTSLLFHGPSPWGIFDTTTRREVMHFDLTGEEQKDEFDFHSWNPRHERLFLRIRHPAKSNFDENTMVEMIDIGNQNLLQSVKAAADEIRWSGDGKWMIISEGKSLFFRRVP